MTHCSLIDPRLLRKTQNLNLFLKALLTPFSVLIYLSESSRYSPHHHNSVLAAFLDLSRLSHLSSVKQPNNLAFNTDLQKATSMLSTVPRVVLLSVYHMHLVGSESRHRPPTTSI